MPSRTVGARTGGRLRRPSREPMRPPPLRSSPRRKKSAPRPSPGPRQERPDAGRSPGSRVKTRCAAFPGVRPVAGGAEIPSACASRSPLTVAGTAAEWGGSLRPHRVPFQASGEAPARSDRPPPKARPMFAGPEASVSFFCRMRPAPFRFRAPASFPMLARVAYPAAPSMAGDGASASGSLFQQPRTASRKR